MNLSRTMAETKTSNPKNALTLLAKSCRARTSKFGPCSMIHGTNLRVGEHGPKKQIHFLIRVTSFG